jgi:2OG-Fe(II) oxygenase superfamily
VPYEHELIDATTGQKRYKFYGVYRPKIAYPFNKTYLEPPQSDAWRLYFDSSRNLGEHLRKILHPYEYPVDRYLAIMDSLMDTNVHIHPRFDKKMQVGMARLMPNNSVTGIHIDRPPNADLGSFRHILSTNFYTAQSSSTSGGELLVWDAPLLPFGSDLKNVKNDYISVHISPDEGDVVMLCPELPHAIARVTEGNRLSLNLFFGLLADVDKLRVWN